MIIASGFPFAWNCDRLLPSVCCLSIHIEEELHGIDRYIRITYIQGLHGIDKYTQGDIERIAKLP